MAGTSQEKKKHRKAEKKYARLAGPKPEPLKPKFDRSSDEFVRLEKKFERPPTREEFDREVQKDIDREKFLKDRKTAFRAAEVFGGPVVSRGSFGGPPVKMITSEGVELDEFERPIKQELDEFGRPIEQEEPRGLEFAEEGTPEEVRGEVGLTEEERIRKEELAAENIRIGERGFGERLLNVDPRLDPTTFPLPIGGGPAIKEGVRGAARFGGFKVHRRGLTDEMFEVLKDGRNTLTNQLNIIGKKTDVSKLGADKAATASRFKTNSKSNKETRTLFQKMGWSEFNGASMLQIIGSYPFAGFMRQEALQTLGFAVTTARESGDVELERDVLAQQDDLLNIAQWKNLMLVIPSINVANEVWNFFKAARKKWEVDTSDFERRREGRLTPEEEYFAPFREKAIRENERFG
tara:strand:+ start:94 stop:1314 length:1221 start_codon:yes stop_codon:yes gene_type:complete